MGDSSLICTLLCTGHVDTGKMDIHLSSRLFAEFASLRVLRVRGGGRDGLPSTVVMMALPARTLIVSPTTVDSAPWRGASRTQIVSALASSSSSLLCTRFERVRVGGKQAFGKELPVCCSKRSLVSVVSVRATQQSLETAPVPAEYQTFVEQVKARLEAERADLPVGKNGRDDQVLILWFLRDRKFDVDATFAKLVKTLEWRREFGVDEITEASISTVAASGEAYLHTCPAKDGKPVIVVTSAKHFPNDETLLKSERHCVYLIEKALLQLPSGGDTFLGIFDLRGFKQRNGDLKFTKFLIDVFFKYYPKRLGQVLFVEAPFVFQPGWSLIKPWVGKYAALVRFCSAEEVRNEYFTPDTIPKSFQK